MLRTTLCFLRKGDQVLLGLKKRKFGTGKWNGVGGKLTEGETVDASAVREIGEELAVVVRPEALTRAGTIHFDYKDNDEWTQECAIFVVNEWEGEPSETEEILPQWYPIDALPFDRMWPDDPHWLPLVLAGKRIDAKFFFDGKGAELLRFEVKEIEG